MRFRRFPWLVLGLVVAFNGLPGASSRAQLAPNGTFPPGGGWAAVVTATPKWLVLQNQQGQQFPVSVDSVQQFVMRWPITPDLISPTALVEATGVDLGSNVLRTEHVDVFEGSDRALVTPGFYTPANLSVNSNYSLFWNYMFNYIQPMYGVGTGPMILNSGPTWGQIVGPVVNLSPLQAAAPGNVVVTIMPSAAGLSMTRVTQGPWTFIRPGDTAYVVPIASNATPRTLALSQLVIYKSVPLDQFTP